MTDLNSIQSYDYHLPEELIAQKPSINREESRLMVVKKHSTEVQHRKFTDILEYLLPGDCLVLNNTKVVPARMYGFKRETKGKWEGLFLRQHADGLWEVIGHSGGKLKAGDVICIRKNSRQVVDHDYLELQLVEKKEQGIWLVQLLNKIPSYDLLDSYGELPLPPYISRDEISDQDQERYQTVFAATPGSVAAPTAGLHFTDSLLNQLRAKGVEICYLTLHVGIGTFRPVNVEQLDQHVMHEECCEISPDTCEKILHTKSRGNKVVAVGTTVVRTLESAARTGKLEPFVGDTRLFIRPPFEFHVIDALVTNYHLPKSTLLVLVSALAGYETIKHAYEIAVAERYRFFSYGDAMLIIP